jgi:hypothetical protein
LARTAVRQAAKWAAPSVAQVVPVDRGDHDIAKAHRRDRLGKVQRLVRIDGLRPTMRDVAERAAAGADVAEDHEGRGAVIEALSQVRAHGLFADGREISLAQQPLDAADARPDRRLGANPRRLAQRLADRLDLDRDTRDLVLSALVGLGRVAGRCIERNLVGHSK